MGAMTKVSDQLLGAIDSESLVRISRSPRNADRVDGFVHAVGSKWVLIRQTGDGGYFDGLVAVRLKDVVKVRRDTSFQGQFAQESMSSPLAV